MEDGRYGTDLSQVHHVSMEIATCWTHVSMDNPEAFLQQYPNRSGYTISCLLGNSLSPDYFTFCFLTILGNYEVKHEGKKEDNFEGNFFHLFKTYFFNLFVTFFYVFVLPSFTCFFTTFFHFFDL